MSNHTVRFTVEFEINDGQLDAFERVAQGMIAGSEKEPGTLGYRWHLSADRRRCRLVETFADADAVLEHLTGSVVQELVPKLLEHARMSRFEVYGNPGPKAAQMLAEIGAEVFAPWRGFIR